jgi:FHS family L-fucose permease-like MFS transporter
MASQMITPARRGMFLTADGRNVILTFALVSSLFLLWGFCNGLIGWRAESDTKEGS